MKAAGQFFPSDMGSKTVEPQGRHRMASWSKQQEPVPNPYDSRPVPGPIPSPRAEEPSSERPDSSDLLLGAGAQFEGKLTFKGTVRIDAKFVGSIVTNDVLVVGERAKIDAEITCGTVVVHGEVNGNVKAKDGVDLRRSAKVHGNIETSSLAIEKGALLQGEVKMATATAEKATARPAADGVSLQ
jgi:cytoskeletal protein CcmA (bactofilin family)